MLGLQLSTYLFFGTGYLLSTLILYFGESGSKANYSGDSTVLLS